MDLPPVTTTEPVVYSAEPVVNPTLNHVPPPPPPPVPAPSFAPLPTHPPYAEMITAAITVLNEREGSSRIAISKYIDRVYSNLPDDHAALLTHHLKRLKNSGYLVMVKHSYMLAGSAPPLPPPAVVDSNGTDVSSLTPKRRPGRPPKPKFDTPAHDQAQVQFQAQPLAQFQPQLEPHQQPMFFEQPHPQFQPDPLLQPQFQPQPQAYVVPQAQNYAGVGAESVFVSLGLVDGPVGVPGQASFVSPGAPGTDASSIKRRPGRPRKDGSVLVKPPSGPGLLDQSGAKKRRGRPPKTGIVDAAPGSAPVGRPRGRPPRKAGRPRKIVAPAAAAAANGGGVVTNVPVGGDWNEPLPTPKRRGRPPKSSYPVTDVGVTEVPIATDFDAPNLPNAAGDAANGSLPIGKRRGRPPKFYTGETVKKPRKLSGKPLGRPRKNMEIVASPTALDAKLVVAYEELKGKLEHLQSKVKETANLVKPCLNTETAGNAIAVLQELEELASAGVVAVQEN